MACDTYRTSDDLLNCVGLKPLFDESAVSNYADRTGAQGGPNNWVRTLTIACLRVNAIIYWINKPGPAPEGDCQGQVRSSANPAAGLIKAGVSAVPVVGQALAQIVGLIPIFAHTQAVANEHAVLCDIAVNYNAYIAQIMSAIQNGQLPLQDATIQFNQFMQGLKQEAASIAHPYNASYGYSAALDALKLMNTEAIFPSLPPGALAGVVNSKVGVGAIAVGAGVVGAKLLGLF